MTDRDKSSIPAPPAEGAHAFRGYRRRIRIEPEPTRVSAWLEDDFHHFGVELIHDGKVVSDVITHAPRFPWATCPAAGAFLQARFRGAALASFGQGEDQRQHCTHFYDLAMVAARHALDHKPITYDISVNEAAEGGPLAELSIDGAPTLRWRMGAQGEQDGTPGGDRDAFAQWTRTLPAELAEAGQMFRRAAPIAGGRRLNLEGFGTASEIGQSGVCYTFQPERAAKSARVIGAIRDFSLTPEKLLSTGAREDKT
jgi:hypothetical protein